MGERKVTILEPAAIAIAEIAFFIESAGFQKTAKKFVAEAFGFFDKLSDKRIEHRYCMYELWQSLHYKCVTYKKKYVIAYLDMANEIVICEFVSAKLVY